MTSESSTKPLRRPTTILYSDDALNVAHERIPVRPPEAKPLADFLNFPTEDPDELLKDRFLSRGGGLLIVGPSGIGKSSFSIQAMLHWAVGKPFLGIRPARVLRSLLVQAENDDRDVGEMLNGVLPGLVLNPQEQSDALQAIYVCREDQRKGAALIQGAVVPLIEKHRPDLLWLDPALAYLSGSANSQEDVGQFLRNDLGPILRRYHLAGILIHHSNKPSPGRGRSEGNVSDYAYLGHGSIEWANWARSILAIRTTRSRNSFELIAAKRGDRIGWAEADGVTKALIKTIGHSETPGVISWQETAGPNVQSGKNLPGAEAVIALVPHDESINKEELRTKANEAKVAMNRINGLIDELISEGRLYEWQVPRKGTRPEKRIARYPQTPPKPIP